MGSDQPFRQSISVLKRVEAGSPLFSPDIAMNYMSNSPKLPSLGREIFLSSAVVHLLSGAPHPLSPCVREGERQGLHKNISKLVSPSRDQARQSATLSSGVFPNMQWISSPRQVQQKSPFCGYKVAVGTGWGRHLWPRRAEKILPFSTVALSETS